ncbi:MAG: DUF5715 family protein [Janthinobacterium lividum]
MFDFPRPATTMSAFENKFGFSRTCVHAGAMTLALAATMLPCARAVVRHTATAPHPAAKTHAVGTHAVAAHAARLKTNARTAPSQRHEVVLSAQKPGRQTALHGRAGHMLPVRTHEVAPPSHGRSRSAPESRETLQPLSSWVKQHPDITPSRRRDADAVADRSTEDRVHAWYKARHTDPEVAAVPLQQPESDEPSTEAPAPVLKAVAASRLGTAKPDPLPQQKATTPPAEAQQKAPANLRSTVSASKPQSTADDDAAFAEASNIPSTAPTEREPAPFVHGDLLAGAATNAPRTGVLARKADTPAVTHIDSRGDAEVLSAGAGRGPVPVHVALSDSLATPKPAPILRSPAPAANAINASAKKPKLDPAVADGMAQQALDPDADSSAAGRKIVTLAAGNAGTDALSKSALTPATGGGYNVDLAGGPLVKVNLYDEAGKLILLPAMKGSHEILVHQNQMAVADGLDRVEDDNQLLDMRRLKLLVALPDDEGMQPDGRLPLNRRYARPWAIRFLNDLSRAHYARFHTPLIVTSAVRTVAFQRRLVLTNGNAAPPTGEIASPHLYGQAIDVAKHGMSVTEIAWMRSYLTPIESSGKIDVEEEFQQACFHLSVYRRYLGLPGPRNDPAPHVEPSRTLQQARTAPAKRRHIPTALLATGLR